MNVWICHSVFISQGNVSTGLEPKKRAAQFSINSPYCHGGYICSVFGLQSKVPCLDVASQAPGHSAELGSLP